MITLNQLSKIASGKIDRDEEDRRRLENADRIRKELEYQQTIKNLEDRLITAATLGIKKLHVAHFSAFAGDNVSSLLHAKRGAEYGNYYVAWNKTIFESDVIEHMQGNLKRVYEYLQSNGLNPKIIYWTDGGGMDEGFELVVDWSLFAC